MATVTFDHLYKKYGEEVVAARGAVKLARKALAGV